MPDSDETKRSVGWMGLARGHQAHPFEWLVEKAIFLVALSVILVILLIFVFIAREALPVFFGRTNSAAATELIAPADIDKTSPEKLRTYLGLTPAEFAKKDKE